VLINILKENDVVEEREIEREREREITIMNGKMGFFAEIKWLKYTCIATFPVLKLHH
jgi:hypothetical protein